MSSNLSTDMSLLTIVMEQACRKLGVEPKAFFRALTKELEAVVNGGITEGADPAPVNPEQD